VKVDLTGGLDEDKTIQSLLFGHLSADRDNKLSDRHTLPRARDEERVAILIEL